MVIESTRVAGRAFGHPLVLLLHQPVEYVDLGLDQLGGVPLHQLGRRCLGDATVDQLGSQGRGLRLGQRKGGLARRLEECRFLDKADFPVLAVLLETFVGRQRLQELDALPAR